MLYDKNYVGMFECVCECECVWKRERERERNRQRQTETVTGSDRKSVWGRVCARLVAYVMRSRAAEKNSEIYRRK